MSEKSCILNSAFLARLFLAHSKKLTVTSDSILITFLILWCTEFVTDIALVYILDTHFGVPFLSEKQPSLFTVRAASTVFSVAPNLNGVAMCVLMAIHSLDSGYS